MRNFDNNRRGDFSRERGGRELRREDHGKSRFGDRDRERPQMHEAICSDCGKKCEVPFRPSGDKPVYCSQCFSSHRENSTPNNFERRGYERPKFQGRDNTINQSTNQYKEQFEILNTKLDKIIKALIPVVPVKEEKKEVIAKKKEGIVEKKEKAKKDKKK